MERYWCFRLSAHLLDGIYIDLSEERALSDVLRDPKQVAIGSERLLAWDGVHRRRVNTAFAERIRGKTGDPAPSSKSSGEPPTIFGTSSTDVASQKAFSSLVGI